ncbi:MAG: S1C family serine protease [Candidatus Dormibacteria bacterium]
MSEVLEATPSPVPEPLSWPPPSYSPPPRRGLFQGAAGALVLVVIAAAAGAGGGYLAAGNRDSHPVYSGLVNVNGASQATGTVSVAESLAMVAAVKRVAPAVVTITTTGTVSSGGGGGSSFQALGTGVIFDTAGHILTNNHVVADGSSYTVLFSDSKSSKAVPAVVVGQDPLDDLAVIQVKSQVPAVAQFGVSRDLQPGQRVLAIGSALGDLHNTVTSGVISALHRSLIDTTTELDDMLQTDAAINHGNSGGPLIDLAGNVVGINTAIAGRSSGTSSDVAQGIGFAIPSDRARSIGLQILAGGVIHPFLGVGFDSVDNQLAAQDNLGVDHGALVKTVRSGSPADHAGIKPGDVILNLNGTEIDADNTLFSLLSQHKVGDRVKLILLRGKSRQTVEVTLAARPTNF